MMLLLCLVIRAQNVHNTTPSVWPDQRHLELDILLIWKSHSRSWAFPQHTHSRRSLSPFLEKQQSLVRSVRPRERSEPQRPCQSQGRHDSSQLESTSSWASMTNDSHQTTEQVDQWWRYGRAVSADGYGEVSTTLYAGAKENTCQEIRLRKVLQFQLAAKARYQERHD